MFISEEEGLRQLTREENILSRLQPSSSPPEMPSDSVQPIITPVEGEDSNDDVTNPTSSGSSISAPFSREMEEGDMVLSPPTLGPARIDPSAALKLNRLLDLRAASTPGRHLEVRNRTDDENASVAVLSGILGQRTTSELTGVTQPQISHLTRASTSPQMTEKGLHKPSLRQKIEEKGGAVIDKAFGVMTDALDSLTLERIKASKTAVISRIARDMSSIVRDVTPREINDGPGVHFHIWRPELAEESDYGEIINVRPIEK